MSPDDIPYVTKRELIRLIQEEGYSLIVTALTDVERNNQLNGKWIIKIVHPATNEEKLFVSHDFKKRVYSTFKGIVSLLHEIGYRTASVPIFEGESWEYGPFKKEGMASSRKISNSP